MANETLVQTKILKYLTELENKKYPVWHERRQAGGFNYKKGIPDVYFVFLGLHIEVECKGIGGTPSVKQLEFERKIKNTGGLYLRTASFEEFKTFVETKLFPLMKK